MVKKGHCLSLGQIVTLLQLVLPRRELTQREAIQMIKSQLERNRAATRSQLRRYGARRTKRKAPT